MYQTERIDRRFLFWIARRLYSARTASVPGAEGPGKLLVVRVDERVGNLVTLQSLLDALRGGFPDAELGLLASNRAAVVARTLQGIDRLHLIDKRWFFSDPSSWKAMLNEVRGRGYQVALDASAWHVFSFTHAALTFYSGAPVRIGYDRGNAGFLTDRVSPGPTGEYELRQRMRLLVPLGLAGNPPALRSSLGEARAEHWKRWLQSRSPGRPVVGIWPGSRKLERRWPIEYFSRLAGELIGGRTVSFVILWGPGEEDLRDRLAAEIGQEAIVAPATDLDELTGLLRNLDLMVTNDTGPMHLAVAVGTPTVCLFASGEPTRWGHPDEHVRNLSAPGKSPEEVEMALTACLQLLDRR